MSKKVISFHDFFNIKEFIYSISKKRKDLNSHFLDILVLEEEKLELKLLLNFEKAKKQMLKTFDEEISNIYKKSLLSKSGDPDAKTIEIISQVNPNPFKDSIFDATNSAYLKGGQSSFATFDIKASFKLRNLEAEKYLKDNALKLSNKVSTSIQNNIRAELLEGIKLAESIPQLRDRVSKQYDKSIQVYVPDKVVNGQVVRSDYGYSLSNKAWATTVARTETARAFAAGKLEGYKQGGVVAKVEFSTSPDERLCKICAGLEGTIYTLKDADGIIPQHANCRCTFIPILGEYSYEAAKKEMAANVSKLDDVEYVYGKAPGKRTLAEYIKNKDTFLNESGSEVYRKDETLEFIKKVEVKGKKLYVEDLERGFSIDADGITSKIIDVDASYGGDRLLIKGKYYDNLGKEVGSFDRDITISKDGNLVANHNYFVLDKNVQGKGVAKSFLKNNVEFYDYIGVKEISVYANCDVGKYTWSKFGFDFAHESELISRRKLFLQHIESKMFKELGNNIGYDDVKKILVQIEKKTAKFKHSWDFSLFNDTVKFDGQIMKVSGKEFMLNGSSWGGTLKLDKKGVSRKMFNKYLGIKEKKKVVPELPKKYVFGTGKKTNISTVLTTGNKDTVKRLFGDKKIFLEDFEKAFSAEGVKIKIQFINASSFPDMDEVRITGHFLDDSGNKIGKFTRTFDNEGGKLQMNHEFFELDAAFRGKGIAKSFLKNNVEYYDWLGVKEISVYANCDVGKYSWAKFGFTAADDYVLESMRTDFVQYLLNKTNRFDDLAWDVKDDIMKRVNEFKYPWDFATFKQTFRVGSKEVELSGKEFMLNGESWKGKLILDKNHVSRRMFDKYLGIEDEAGLVFPEDVVKKTDEIFARMMNDSDASKALSTVKRILDDAAGKDDFDFIKAGMTDADIRYATKKHILAGIEELTGNKDMADFVEDNFEQWFGGSSSNGGGMMKYFASKLKKRTDTIYHEGFIDSNKELVENFEKFSKRYFENFFKARSRDTIQNFDKLYDEYSKAMEFVQSMNVKILEHVLDGKKLKVYRGVKSDYLKLNKINIDPDATEINVMFNSVESWTFNKRTANNFNGGNGVIFEMELDLRDILSTYFASPSVAYTGEFEIIIASLKKSRMCRIVK